LNNEYHTPVLLTEALRFLLTDANGIYVDGTLGGGGHAEGICERLGENGRLICFDADEDAVRFASERLKEHKERVTLVHTNFRNLKSELHALGVRSINGVLLDLGVSSFQLDVEAKGFSFHGDDRIDMRMDRRQAFSGWNVVNDYDEVRLADIIWKYGEERNSRRIARRIVEARPIEATGELASTIESAVGKKFLVKTLARVFQAIRIEVNDELKNLEQALADAIELMAHGGRIVVISYHSLEDRIVKKTFKTESLDRIPSGSKLVPDTRIVPMLRVLTKSPIEASEEEIARNPRARSAKMRVAQRM
jgi:16S rRNA (cytosine1402-N4)-methyltransferase